MLPDEGFYILPPLVLSVDCEYDFDEVCQGAGRLTLPSDSRFWLGDGQHRAAEFLQAYLEAPAMMNDETVGVMLLPDAGNQVRHQVFLDINANASKPSKSIATLFDERDHLADVTRNLLALPWVERYTNLERTTLPKSSGDLFTLNGWRDANRELLANIPESNWDRVAAGYWKAIAETIPQWRDILTAVEQEQSVDAPMLRQDYICFHSITLSALGLLGQQLIGESGQVPDLSGLAAVNWSRSNPDWEGIFLFEGKIIKNKQSATRFADYLQAAL